MARRLKRSSMRGRGTANVEVTVKSNFAEWKTHLAENAAVNGAALRTAANMIASMLRTEITADIQSAGNFGSQFIPTVTVQGSGEGVTISTKIDGPGAEIFEKGGTIHGKPLLWLPISGTDAVGTEPREYGDKLFSVNRQAGGVPLLFSVRDQAPKYFGVPSVTIPKKFHIAEIQNRVMGQFPEIFNAALKG